MTDSKTVVTAASRKRKLNYHLRNSKESLSVSHGDSGEELDGGCNLPNGLDNVSMWSKSKRSRSLSSSEVYRRTAVQNSVSRLSGRSKFLLGGNIHDPLNLNSLSAKTEKNFYSDLSNTDDLSENNKIQVVIPPNIQDPLNLTAAFDDREFSAHLSSLGRRNNVKLKRKRKRRDKRKPLSKKDSSADRRTKQSEDGRLSAPDRAAKAEKFEYGNYNRYYGYRYPSSRQPNHLAGLDDVRLKHIRQEWIKGKDVLDIGCNTGRLTLAIALKYQARSVRGVDIDKNLIRVARKSAAKALSAVRAGQLLASCGEPAQSVAEEGHIKPCSSKSSDGGKSIESKTSTDLPSVRFFAANYVLDHDELIEAVKPEFDVILCMSTTKWIQLNFGDAGLKRAFKRMYAQLRPGGLLILEPQPFASYKRRKRLTERIATNYRDIQLKPDDFAAYLTSEVGFAEFFTDSEEDSSVVPLDSARGFQRPIQFFVKRHDQSMVGDVKDITPQRSDQNCILPSPPVMGGQRVSVAEDQSMSPLPRPMSYFSTTPQHDSLSAAMHSRTTRLSSQRVVDDDEAERQISQGSTPFYAHNLVLSPSHWNSTANNTPRRLDYSPAYTAGESPRYGPSGVAASGTGSSSTPYNDYYWSADSPYDELSAHNTPTFTANPSSLTPGYSGPSPDHSPLTPYDRVTTTSVLPNAQPGRRPVYAAALCGSVAENMSRLTSSNWLVNPAPAVASSSSGQAASQGDSIRESPTQSNIACSPIDSSERLTPTAYSPIPSPCSVPQFSPGNATPRALEVGDSMQQYSPLSDRDQSPSTTTADLLPR